MKSKAGTFVILVLTGLFLSHCKLGDNEVKGDFGSEPPVPDPVLVERNYNLSPSGDTTLNRNNSNMSTLDTLYIYTWPNFGDANTTVIQFDLSAVPTGAVVTSAALNLELIEAWAGGCVGNGEPVPESYEANLYRIINFNPDLSVATGLTYDGVNEWTDTGAAYEIAMGDLSSLYDSQQVSDQLGNKQWDMTAMVQYWLDNPSENNGLAITSDASKRADCRRQFASMEHADLNKRPFLDITANVLE